MIAAGGASALLAPASTPGGTVAGGDAAATGVPAGLPNPFAELLATVSPSTAMPIALPVDGLAGTIPPAAAVETMMAGTLPGVAEGTSDGTSDLNAAAATEDEAVDPLADAIAAGPMAVLALAPFAAPPVQAQPIAAAPVANIAGSPAARVMPAANALPGIPMAATQAAPAVALPRTDQQTKDAAQPARPTATSTAADGTPLPDSLKALLAAAQQDRSAEAKAKDGGTAAPLPNGAAAKAPAQSVALGDAKPTPDAQPVLRRRTDGGTVAEALPIGLSQRVNEPVAGTALAGAAPIASDIGVEQQLTVAKDGAWLDTLAREIAHSAGGGNNLHFKLNPQHLGALSVAIAHSDDGASIRLTADTDATRNLLVDNQPRLVAEARAQGLRISDTQVDVRQQDNGSSGQSRWDNPSGQQQHQQQQQALAQNGQGGQNRQSSTGHQPFARNQSGTAEADSTASGDADALYA